MLYATRKYTELILEASNSVRPWYYFVHLSMICTGQESWGRCEMSIESFLAKAEGKIRLGRPVVR